jgi:hypothetical protein
MKKIIAFLRQTSIVLLVGITVFFAQAIGCDNFYLAQAEPVTPEATAYRAEGIEQTTAIDKNNPLEQVKQNLKETAENVKEKLNLDEPLDPGTKEVLNSAQKNVEKTVKPLTGKEQGTYQHNTPRR